MITHALIWLIAMLVFTQPSWSRFSQAGIFAGLTAGHMLAFDQLDGLAYYGSAALTDLSIMAWLTSMTRVTWFTMALMRISFASILLNAFGWVTWQLYLSPFIYDAAFIVLYTWVVITLIRRGHGDVGGYTMDRWHPRIPVPHRYCDQHIKHGGD